MKVGDLVMFVDNGSYAKWFWGHMGTVMRYTVHPTTGHKSCRVKWLKAVPYHSRLAYISDFDADKFKVCS